MNNTENNNITVVNSDNKTEFFINNELSRIEYIDEKSKTTKLYKNGQLHNDNGPAIIHDYGNTQTKEWYKNGQLHREDGPAIEHYTGDKEWYLNGKLHRDNGPAIEGKDNLWLQHGVMHREDGPALEINGGLDGKVWYKNAFIHREDGPASIINGVEKWHLEGKEYSKEAFEKEMIKRANMPHNDDSLLSNVIKTLREHFLNKDFHTHKKNIK